MVNRLKFFIGTKDTIIYRLVMRNQDYDAFLKKKSISNCRLENGRGRHAGAKVSGASRPDQKVGPLGPGWTFWVNRYLKNQFQKFRA